MKKSVLTLVIISLLSFGARAEDIHKTIAKLEAKSSAATCVSLWSIATSGNDEIIYPFNNKFDIMTNDSEAMRQLSIKLAREAASELAPLVFDSLKDKKTEPQYTPTEMIGLIINNTIYVQPEQRIKFMMEKYEHLVNDRRGSATQSFLEGNCHRDLNTYWMLTE
ncbi:hypothetical protein [Vibrio lentus]|uniref:hypothetical protein n=1 Tax=Vibrio lentus TaxID=136468 RepID=UPI000977C351|nr:hypothetical protein [Vibrio lentus]OMO20330.1 hypothetical protein BH583_13245 [Vibrio lentus]PMN11088.1 hypothetical protein BCT38_04665 [Vibrio lentus]